MGWNKINRQIENNSDTIFYSKTIEWSTIYSAKIFAPEYVLITNLIKSKHTII